MIILGIDPGSRHTGYGVVSREGTTLRALAEGRISPTSKEPAIRLVELSQGVDELVERWQPDKVAIESLFHGVNTRSLIVLAQARGALLAAIGRHGLTPREFSPAEVKSAVTGYGRADKQQVSQMVELLLGLRSKKRAADATDALALAICCAQLHRMDRIQEQSDAQRRSNTRISG